MRKLDLHRELKRFYAPSAKQVEIIEVPRFQFAMIDGAIEPGASPATSAGFGEAMQALYGVSYALKFSSKKKEDPIDYPVMALEGLWWVEDGNFDIGIPDNWHFTLMMFQPDHITTEMFAEALIQLERKRGDSPALSRLRLEPFAEGLAVQIMHVGPYAAEPATVDQMRAFAIANGYRMRDKHHEIYLGDPRRADPANLKTVLRHPIEQL